jgi:hypothetical protein
MTTQNRAISTTEHSVRVGDTEIDWSTLRAAARQEDAELASQYAAILSAAESKEMYRRERELGHHRYIIVDRDGSRLADKPSFRSYYDAARWFALNTEDRLLLDRSGVRTARIVAIYDSFDRVQMSEAR